MVVSHASLHALPALRFLPAEDRSLVIEHFVPQSFVAGDELITSDERPQALYVLVSGQAQIIKTGLPDGDLVIRNLQAGDSVGEKAFFETRTATSTVRANSDLVALALNRATFTSLLRRRPDLRSHVALESRRRRLLTFCRLYSPLPAIPPDALSAFLNDWESVSVPQGARVIHQGDAPGPLYIVESGQLRVTVEKDGRQYEMISLGAGDFFGEMAMIQDAPRAASVDALSPCRLLECSAASFDILTAQFPTFRAQLEARAAQYTSP